MSSKQRILLVDDEPDILEFLGFNLEMEGYEVQRANNGAEGVEKAKGFLPDLVLMDVMMPVMDGFECLAELEKIVPALTHDMHVFMLSSSIDRNNISKAEKFEMVKRVIEKPLDVYTLKMALEDIFSD